VSGVANNLKARRIEAKRSSGTGRDVKTTVYHNVLDFVLL